MANVIDDDDLQDDTWDDLPPEAFDALEQDALQSTQQHTVALRPVEVAQTYHTLPTLPSTSVRLSKDSFQQQQTQTFGNGFAEDDFSEVEEHVAKLEESRETERRQWNRPATYGQPGRAENGFGGMANPRGATITKMESKMQMDQPGHDMACKEAPIHDSTITNLQAQIQQLMREREELKQSLHQATSEVLAKTGEVKIVRANQAQHEKEWMRRMIAHEKQQEAQVAKAQAELAKTIHERNSLQTLNQFEKQDVREETLKQKQARRQQRDANLMTPKKNRLASYRDGFDDGEIMAMSPSRSGGRSRIGTPRLGGKRKRRGIDDSPVPMLQLSQTPRPVVDREESQQSIHEKLSARFHHDDRRYEFLQLMLSHRMSRNQPRTFEQLTKYCPPTKSEVSMASILLDEMSLVDSKDDTFIIDVCQIFLTQWSRCVEERYYPPIPYLMSLLISAMATDTSSKAPSLTDNLVRVAQLTAEVHIIPRHHCVPASEECIDIDVSACLKLLLVTALGCVHVQEAIRRFWRYMRFDFVSMLLYTKQRSEDVLLMLELLELGVLEDSFGPIAGGDEATQVTKEKNILDGMATLLLPVSATDRTIIERDQMVDIRLAVLHCLGVSCCSPHSGRAIARHPTLIARLVKIINDEMDALYSFRGDHSRCAEQVNLATRVLFQLVSTYPEDIDLQEKLSVISGGTHKHRVGLARLTFSQGLVLEAEIEDEVVEFARSMLDRVVTPEEGEALAAAFGV